MSCWIEIQKWSLWYCKRYCKLCQWWRWLRCSHHNNSWPTSFSTRAYFRALIRCQKSLFLQCVWVILICTFHALFKSWDGNKDLHAKSASVTYFNSKICITIVLVFIWSTFWWRTKIIARIQFVISFVDFFAALHQLDLLKKCMQPTIYTFHTSWQNIPIQQEYLQRSMTPLRSWLQLPEV